MKGTPPSDLDLSELAPSRPREPVRVTLDVQEMRSSIALWRDTVLLLCHPEPRSSPELRLIERKMLEELHRTLTGWLDLLRMCRAQGPDANDLQDICVEVAACKAWTAESLAAVNLNDSVENLHPDDQQP